MLNPVGDFFPWVDFSDPFFKKKSMSVSKIEFDMQSASFLREYQIVGQSDIFDDECSPWLIECSIKASNLPGGYIKKIIWDAEGGFPGFSHGTIQYSPRPYVQGYGCDGTSDENIHLIGSLLCAKLDIDYIAAYVQAYDPAAEELEWLRSLSSNQSLFDETVIPECAGPNELAFMLSDLYAINHRSLVCVLEDIFQIREIPVADWLSL